MQRKTVGLLLGTALALAFGVHDASAAKRQVGTCTTNPLQYSTIQAAVDASNSGDVVQICPGSYPEQVNVTKSIGLTNVPTLASPTIAVPAGGAVQNTQSLSGFPVAAQVLVSGANGYVKNLTVDGTGNNIQTCGLNLVGIYFQNAGGSIENNTVENQLLPPGFQGCQSGLGIYVQNQNSGTSAVTISGNTVDNFDKNGITVSYGAAHVSIQHNTVTGIGPTDQIAQNGIQLGYGASGSIKSNTVSNLIYTPGTYGSAGILLYDIESANALATPQVLGNTVSSSQYGIVLDAVNGTSGKLLPVTSNNVSGASFAGIQLYSDYGLDEGQQVSDDYIRVNKNIVDGTNPYDNIDVCSDNNVVQSNTVSNSAEGGVHLDGLCQEEDGSSSGVNNLVSANQIEDNCVGILSGPAPGANAIKRNTFTGNTNNYEYNTDSFSCTAHHRGTSKRLMPLARVQALRS